MLTAICNGKKAHAWKTIPGTANEYTCDECKKNMIFKQGHALNQNGEKRANCFSHKPGEYNSSIHFQKEDYDNAWHINIQNMIASALGDDIELEKKIGNNRADCWHTKSEYAIEVQHSPIDAKKILDREQTYKRVIWLLDGETYNLFQLRDKDITWNYLGNNFSPTMYKYPQDTRIIDTSRGVIFIYYHGAGNNELEAFVKITPWKEEYRLDIMNKNNFIKYLSSSGIDADYDAIKKWSDKKKQLEANLKIDQEIYQLEKRERSYEDDLANTINSNSDERIIMRARQKFQEILNNEQREEIAEKRKQLIEEVDEDPFIAQIRSQDAFSEDEKNNTINVFRKGKYKIINSLVIDSEKQLDEQGIAAEIENCKKELERDILSSKEHIAKLQEEINVLALQIR